MMHKLLLTAWLLLWMSCVTAEPRVELEISGLEKPLAENVRAHLGIARLAPASGNGFIPLPAFERESPPLAITETNVRRLHRRAAAEIRSALQPFGYYEPQIRSQLERDGETWRASYQIDPGPATYIEQVSIRIDGDGAQAQAILAARDASRLQEGDRLLHTEYQATKEALLKAALAEGYLDARYERAELRVYKSRHGAEIDLWLDTGPRYYFGDISIRQDILDPDFLQRVVKIEAGEPFATDALLDLQLSLGDSGYFSRVEVDPRRDAASDHRIPVNINTEPAKPRRYAYGLGYGTDTGPRVSLLAEFRRINRRGHSIITDLSLSKILRSIGAQYRIPIGNVVSDRLVFSSRLESEKIADENTTKRFTLGVSRNEGWGPLQRRLYMNYQHENLSLGEDTDTVNFLVPGVSLTQLRADDVLFPRRGYSWSADLRGTPGIVSDTWFTRLEVAGKTVFPLGERGRLLLRSRLGAVEVGDFSQLPANDRFYAGGDQSVRGYAYQRLAPEDDSGKIVGGRYLAVASAEMDYLFYGNFGAAVFVDSGNADDAFLPPLKTGAGIGLRWRSPVGMLRVDIAHPFDDPDNNYRLHITFGPYL